MQCFPVRRRSFPRRTCSFNARNAGEILLVLMELRDAVVFYNRSGYGVKLEGLGTYLPSLQLDGSLDVEIRRDRSMRNRLNESKTTARVRNRKQIGKTADELVALWNAEHPDDPVE